MNKPDMGGWSWAKVGNSAAAKAAAVAFIGIGALWAYFTGDEVSTAQESSEHVRGPLQLVTSLQGARLGQTLAELAATHGPFEKQPVRPEVVRKYAGEEEYLQKRGPLRLVVREGFIRSLFYPCGQGKDASMVNNVACHGSGDTIRKVFGENVRVLCAKVKPNDPDRAMAPHVRAYDAVRYGTRYIVVKDVVQAFIVMDPEELESLVGFNWEECG